jgi:hypothetical protein
MDKYQKSLLLNMSNEYSNIVEKLHDVLYLLRVQGRHREADLIVSAIEKVKAASEVLRI